MNLEMSKEALLVWVDNGGPAGDERDLVYISAVLGLNNPGDKVVCVLGELRDDEQAVMILAKTEQQAIDVAEFLNANISPDVHQSGLEKDIDADNLPV